MKRPNEKGGSLQTWRAVHPVTARQLRNSEGARLAVQAYTRRSAIHQLKKLTDEDFEVRRS
jgi:hypothetical protein